MSVDLDALINQSKQRLSKHKEYLEKTSQRTGYSSANNIAAINDDPSSSRRKTEELSFSPLRPEERNPQFYANNNNNQNNIQNQQQPSTGFSPLQNQTQQTPQFNPYSSNIARAGYNNFGEPDQQQPLSSSRNHNNNSSSRGRPGFYLSSRTPTKVYDRGQKFVESRESFLERQRQEAWEKEMKDCTFSPFISRKAATMKSSGGNGGKSPSPERPGANNKNNRSASEEGRPQQENGGEPQLDNQEFLDWCVHSDKTNVGFHVDAPSVFLHIQRQQDARKQRAEGQAKLTVDTAHWRPKVTVPQEFNFGRSDQPIRSLKKPIMNMVRLSSGDTTVQSRSGSASGAAAGRLSKSPASRRGTPRVSKSPIRQKKNNNGDDNDEDDEEAAAAEAEKKRIAKMKELELAQREQQRQIREQSDEIQKLSGMLSAMKMEAEAAKAKVREMTLAQTIAGNDK